MEQEQKQEQKQEQEQNKQKNQELRVERKNKNKCEICGKRLGISGIECKCGTLTCMAHRYPYEHSCTFDHKKSARDKLIKDNPKIIKDKFPDRI